MHDEPIRRFAHYELLGEIGRGGMGVVYRALDTRLRRKVAIKLLPAPLADAPRRRARLLREAQAAAKLNHPNIATVYEIGETLTDDPALSGASGKAIYIAMEYVEGEDLRTYLEEGLTLDESLSYGTQIAEALACAHRAGVIHRDLKPGNVRITPEGRVKILDFGLAKVAWDEADATPPAEACLTKTGVIVGTIPYMAPEQLDGEELDERSDLFSFGVLLYQMLTGCLPFDGARMVDYARSLASRVPRSPSQSNPAIPARLGKLVQRLLERDPKDRCPSSAAVVAELRAITRDDPGSVPTISLKLLRPRPSLRRRGWRWAAAALVPLATLAAAAFGGAHRASPSPHHLAVLPFENRTAEPALDAYYEGVGSALTSELAKLPGFRVVNELDVRRFRGGDETVEEIARELGVGTLVRGYVQGSSGHVRVTAQVMRTIPSVIVWGGSVDGDPNDLLSLQAKLIDDLIRHLALSPEVLSSDVSS